MNLIHKKIGKRNTGFTLIEVVAATTILAIITSGVWIVIDRCVMSTADSKMKMQAFEVARENLETILAKPAVRETTDNGISLIYPEIEWETAVETFYEPINSQMWLRAICTAYYYDTRGEQKSIKLEHWLTGINKQQLFQILFRDDNTMENLDSQLIETIDDAAQYAGVNTDTIQEWLKNGMKTTENDFFVKTNLDLFKLNDGKPAKVDINNLQVTSQEDLNNLMFMQNKQNLQNVVDSTTGLTYGQMDQMNLQDIWEILKLKREGDLK